MVRQISKKGPLRGLFCLGALLLLALGCDRGPEQVKFEGRTMGTSYHVTYRPVEEGPSPEEVRRLVEMLLEELEDKMSTYRPDSELSRFNAHQSAEPFGLSPETLRVLGEAKSLGERSGGALDVTLGPVVELWGFGPQARQGVPDEQAVQAALARTGLEHLSLDAKNLTASKTLPGLRLDLSSIAKGYAVDQVSELLGLLELNDHLVEIGGEVRASGEKAGGHHWRIGIERPDAAPGEIAQVVALHNHSMATSGDYRNYFEAGGTKYAHGIDRRTGKPAVNRLASVSVVHHSCMTADGWATALMVLGEEEGFRLAEEQGLMAHFIYRTAEGFKTRDTTAFEAFLQQQAR